MSSSSVKVGFTDITISILEKSHSLLASFLRVFVEHAKAARPHGYYCAICPFSSGGNIIQLDPVPRVNSSPGGGGGAFAAVLSLIVVIKLQRLLKSSR